MGQNEINKKHHLHTAWSIWEHSDSRDAKSNYGDSMKEICTFDTIEDFWGYWNNMPYPSEILYDGITKKRFENRSVKAYSVFRKNIAPKWEDEQNKFGAEYIFHQTLSHEELDDLWEKLIISFIGGTIDPEDEITGARVIHKNRKDKNCYNIEIWLRSTVKEKGDKIRDRAIQLFNTSEKCKGKIFGLDDFFYKTH